MPKLVKIDSVGDDPWQLIDKESLPSSAAQLEAYSLIPAETYCQWAEQLPANVAPWLASDEDVVALADKLTSAPVIALHFAAFADGRSFSQARQLREQLEFTGELRAVGAFIQDQLFYLRRCGFDAFSVADDADLESIKTSLEDFSESYQAACDVKEPLFRRRA
ncbi:DUF934 domain-containing protein [Agaribacterium haliotis]|uniref:DUF934 domain-containing protein n=1 Tax=Agaribacterium haliotis TaxID=2013869 RepID=UPI000BB5382A|nr:DUF934 domain-containing protein [Agaribacterium haliotis]